MVVLDISRAAYGTQHQRATVELCVVGCSLAFAFSTSDTGSGREEEEGWRIELDSCTRGETAPKSDRLKVQQVVLRTEEEEEMGWAVEEEEELGARLRVVGSPCSLASCPARLRTLTGEARRRVGGETPDEAG